MKKTYQIPQSEVITISVTQMIAGSYGSPENGVNLNYAETTDETEGNLSRYNVWEDDEMDSEY